MTLTLFGLKFKAGWLFAGILLAPLLGQMALQIGALILVRSTVLLLLGLAVVHLLRYRPPALRALVLRATLGAVVLSTLFSLLLLGRIEAVWHVSIPSAMPTQTAFLQRVNAKKDQILGNAHKEAVAQMEAKAAPAKMPPGDRVKAAPLASIRSSQPLSKPRQAAPDARPAASLGWLYVAMVAAWLSGTILLLLWLAACHVYACVMCRQSIPLREGAVFELLQRCAPHGARAPRLMMSRRVRGPFLAGAWRPTIFLPATHAQDFDDAALRAILLHELAHWARRDLWWNWLARLACAVLWPQPLLWLLCRRLEQVNEEVCDEAVIAGGCSPRQYAGLLLDLAERLSLRPAERAVGAGVVPFRSSLGRRVQQILNASQRGTARLSRGLRAAVGALTFGAVAASLVLVASQAATGPLEVLRPQLVWQAKYAGGVETVAFSPDGTLLAAACWDHKVRLHDVASGKLKRVLTGHKDRVLAVAIAPDGASLASGGRDGIIKLWNVAGGRLQRTFDGDEGWINVLTFSPDGKWLVSGSRNVRFWNAATGKLTRILPLKQNSVRTLTFSPDGATLSVGTVFRTVYLWDVRSGSLLHKLEKPKVEQREFYGHATQVNGAVFTPDGQSLITGCWDGKGRRWDTRNGDMKQMFTLAPPDAGLTSLALSPGGAILAGGSDEVKLWDAQTLKLRATLPGYKNWVRSLVFSPDGSLLASGAWENNAVKVWRLRPAPVPGTASISGRVVYEDGRPAAGIEVVAAMHDEAETRLRYGFYVKGKFLKPGGVSGKTHDKTVTDGDGRYDLSGLSTGPFSVIANTMPLKASQYQEPPAWVAGAANVLLKKSATVPVNDLILTRGAILQGRVIDAASGRALPGIHVGCHGPHRPLSGGWIDYSITDAAGFWKLRVPPGRSFLYTAGPVTSRPFHIHWEDSPVYKKDLEVIEAGGRVYARSDWVEVRIDGGAPRYLRFSGMRMQQVDTRRGQTHEVLFRFKQLTLSSLRHSTRPGGPTVEIPAQPPLWAFPTPLRAFPKAKAASQFNTALEAQIAALEVKHLEMLTAFRPQSPEVRALEQSLSKSRRRLNQQRR